MLSLNFNRSSYDYCLNIGEKYRSKIYIILYVDDLLIFGANIDIIEEVKLMLSRRFKMKDLGPVKQYLGIEINCNKKKRKCP